MTDHSDADMPPDTPDDETEYFPQQTAGDTNDVRVAEITHGTVIDHIPAGFALTVLNVLGIDGSTETIVSVGMNIASSRYGTKDIIKVEDRELTEDEVDVLALIAPDATINIIRETEVVAKQQVDRPAQIEGVIKCPNHNCITRTDEPITPTFDVAPEHVQCTYCDTLINEEELSDYVIPSNQSTPS